MSFQYEFQLNKDTKQTMSVDPDNSVVVYHVSSKDVDADIVDDFKTVRVQQLSINIICDSTAVNEFSKYAGDYRQIVQADDGIGLP